MQRGLQVAAFHGQVAATVGRDPSRFGGQFRGLQAGQFRPGTGCDEGEGLGGVVCQARQQPGGVAGEAGGGLPQHDGAGGGRGGRVGDNVHSFLTDQGAPEVGGVRCSGGAEQAGRVGAVGGGEASQPPQHLRDMRPENPLVAMGLVDDDVAQPAQQCRPAAMVRQHGEVQHVGVGEHQVGVFAGESPLGLVGVAVEGTDPYRSRGQGLGRPGLVVGQGLGGRQVQRGGAAQRESPAAARPGFPQRGEHRHQVGQRLPGTGGGADRGVTASAGQLRELRLVPPGPVDTRGPEPVDEFRIEPAGPVGPRPRGSRPAAHHHRLLGPGHPLPVHPPNSATPRPLIGSDHSMKPVETAHEERATRDDAYTQARCMPGKAVPVLQIRPDPDLQVALLAGLTSPGRVERHHLRTDGCGLRSCTPATDPGFRVAH